MTEETITWGNVQDRHCMGNSILGKLWVRLNKENKVSGLYTMWGETFKWVPNTKEEETLDGTKIVASLMLNDKIKMIEFLKNGNTRDTI